MSKPEPAQEVGRTGADSDSADIWSTNLASHSRAELEHRVRELERRLQDSGTERAKPCAGSGQRTLFPDAPDPVRAILEHSSGFLFTLSLEGTIRWANQAACRFARVTPAEANGRQFWNTPGWEHSAETQASLRTAVAKAASGQRVRLVATHSASTGEIVDVDYALTPIKDSAGTVIELLAEGRDITEPKREEASVRQLNAELEERVRRRTAELRAANAELQKSRQRLRDILDNVDVIISEWDLATMRPTFVNERAEELLGYPLRDWYETPEFWVGKLLHADDREQAAGLCARETEAVRDHEFQYRALRQDGEVVWLREYVRVIPDAAGNPTSIVCVMVDVTQQLRAEEEKRRSEQRTIEILAALKAHVAVVDRRGTIVAVNPAWEEFARANQGTAAKCNVGANYLDACRAASSPYAQEAPRVLAGLEAIIAGEVDEFSLEYPCHSPHEDRWFLLQITPLESSDGAVISHTNITDRVLAERSLRKEHAFTENLINTAHNIILLLDTQGRILRMNPYLETLVGWQFDELKGQQWVTRFIPEESRETVRKLFATAIQGDSSQGNTCTIRTRYQGEREIEWYHAPLTDDAGRLVGLLCTGQDITDRRLLERELLEVATEEQRRIGSDLHDGICQQLTGLGLLAQGFVDMLKAPEAAAVLEKLDLGHLAEVAEKMSRGVSETTHHARTLSHGLTPVSIDGSGLVTALRELAQSTDQLKAIQCRFDAETPVAIPDNFAATHLYRIAQEAVNNAVKHSEATLIQIRVSSTAETTTLSVTDNGKGLPADRAEFAGLGLRIMKYRADLIGADLEVHSEPEQGTRIHSRWSPSRRPNGRTRELPNM